ncbi:MULTISPECIES: hypothetical protein [unclassified Rhizobium]|uniref:hypothetical protein n=1 Tax=unclassified Rhizobium TaxID=2613769 RepID=UPI001FCD8AC3|nr:MULTISPECIES: hypothetical protein [unclassified Rhizobium]
MSAATDGFDRYFQRLCADLWSTAFSFSGKLSGAFMPIDFKHSLPSRARNTALDSIGQHPPAVEQTGRDALDRLEVLGSVSPQTRTQASRFLKIAKRGLPRMHRGGAFGHTLRAVKTDLHWTEHLEGDSLRYTAIAALGLFQVDRTTQQQILGGNTVLDLANACVVRATTSADMGAVALAAWAAAEAGRFHSMPLFRQLVQILASDTSIATVDCAWALSAGLAARQFGDTRDVVSLATKRLMSGRSSSGLFPHMLPASASGRFRAHIGCFADQVYPIQAFSRLHAAQPNIEALSAAEACAERICALQGPAGQWWWHYDTRNGGVVEGYPVYSVHQHAMAPMALLELREAGGTDHSQAIIKGMRWLDEHPEVSTPLVAAEKGVIWRKVGRREPRKIVRAISAVTTALMPGLHVPGLDRLFPPICVDYECRPYELGWLMYAWLSGGVVAQLSLSPAGEMPAVSKEI